MQAHGVHGNNSAMNVITFVVDNSASSHMVITKIIFIID